MRISATEASRDFSRILSRAAAGESIEVNRHGQVVAVVVPPRPATVSGEALLALLERLPSPDDRFADDVKGLAKVTVTSADPWQS